ncbi:uncharacterized protein LOC135843291 isoform X2 [Planococcus citri]|uniref:uncharacterized protein LOC135843291 isoform X2 n=1 Tax=Planococcus citri TaxID=170843 RepID=UPI0031F97315
MSDSPMELGESTVVNMEAFASKIHSYLKMDPVEFPAYLLDRWKKVSSTFPKLSPSLYIDEERYLDTLFDMVVTLRDDVWERHFYGYDKINWSNERWLAVCLSSYISLKIVAEVYLKEPNELFFSLFELWPNSERTFQKLFPFSPKDPDELFLSLNEWPRERILKPEMNSILKGILIIHMLDDYLGEKVRDGIIELTRSNRSIESPEEFWKILSQGNSDKFDVAKFVDSYNALSPDFPVISAQLDKNTAIRFENDASSRYSKFPVTVSMQTKSETKVKKFMLDEEASRHSFEVEEAEWFKVNHFNAGLYTLNLDGNLKNICSLPISELTKLNSIDRASVLLNLDFSTKNGLMLAVKCFGFLKGEEDIIPLATAYRKFLYISRFLYGTRIHQLFLAYIDSLIEVKGDIVDDGLSEDDANRAYNCMIFHIGCLVGSKLCLEKAEKIFQTFLKDDTSAAVEFLNCAIIYGAAGNSVSFKEIQDKYLGEMDKLKESLLARVLGSLKEADLEKCLTEMILPGKMPLDHVVIFFCSCAKITSSFCTAWKFLITSREALIKQLSVDVFMLIIGEFVPSIHLDEHFAELDDLLSYSIYDDKRCIIETAKKKKVFISDYAELYNWLLEYFNGNPQHAVAKRRKLDEFAIQDKPTSLDKPTCLDTLQFEKTTVWDTLEFFKNLDVTTVSRINAWETIRTFDTLSSRKLCVVRPPCWGKTTTLHILLLYYSKVFNKETLEEVNHDIPIDVFKGHQSFSIGKQSYSFLHSAEDEKTPTTCSTIPTEWETSCKNSYACFHLDLSIIVGCNLSEVKTEITAAVHKTLALYKSLLNEHERFGKCFKGTCIPTDDHIDILASVLRYLQFTKVCESPYRLLFVDEIDLPLIRLENATEREKEEIKMLLMKLVTHVAASGCHVISFGVYPSFCGDVMADHLAKMYSLDEPILKPVFGLNHVEVMHLNNKDTSLVKFAGGYTYPGTKPFSLYCMHLRENEKSMFEETWLRSKLYDFIWKKFNDCTRFYKLLLQLLENGYAFASKEELFSDHPLNLLYHSGFVVKTCAGNLSLELWRDVKNDHENQPNPMELVYYVFPNFMMKDALRSFLDMRHAS